MVRPRLPKNRLPLQSRPPIKISCKVLSSTWPMCSMPVTLGGGIIIQYGSRDSSTPARKQRTPATYRTIMAPLLQDCRLLQYQTFLAGSKANLRWLYPRFFQAQCLPVMSHPPIRSIKMHDTDLKRPLSSEVSVEVSDRLWPPHYIKKAILLPAMLAPLIILMRLPATCPAQARKYSTQPIRMKWTPLSQKPSKIMDA